MYYAQLLEDGTLRPARTQEADLPVLLHQLTATDEGPTLQPWLQPAYAQLRAELLAILPHLEAGPAPATPPAELPIPPEIAALAPAETLRHNKALNIFLDQRLDGLETRLRAETRGFNPALAEHAARVLAFTFEGGKAFLNLRARRQWTETRRRVTLASPEIIASVDALGLAESWRWISLLNDHYGTLCGFTAPTPDAPTPDAAYDAALDAAPSLLARFICLANLASPPLQARLLAPWLTLQREYTAERRR